MAFHGFCYKEPRSIEKEMRVLVASCLGFCTGVNRALAMAESVLTKSKEEGFKPFFWGDIVHNSHVCNYYHSHGFITINSTEDIQDTGSIVIRAHGITDEALDSLKNKGFSIIDATCPVVLKAQEKIRNAKKDVIIFGYEGHSEVTSLRGSAKRNVSIISEVTQLDNIKEGSYLGIVQSTFSSLLLDELLSSCKDRAIEVEMANNICSASIKRRESVRELLDKIDCLVVVGDKKSSNTRELGAIAEKANIPYYIVEDEASIVSDVFSFNTVGVTAGASTPKEIYLEVIKRLKSIENGD